MERARHFRFRDARESDFSFAEALYLGTMEALLLPLGDWDLEKFRARFKAQYKIAECRVIVADGRDIGFVQVAETETERNIAQLHLADGYRGIGIGSKIAKDLIAGSERDGKTISLSTPRNNKAIALYKRLGFKISQDDGESIISMARIPGSAGSPKPDET